MCPSVVGKKGSLLQQLHVAWIIWSDCPPFDVFAVFFQELIFALCAGGGIASCMEDMRGGKFERAHRCLRREAPPERL